MTKTGSNCVRHAVWALGEFFFKYFFTFFYTNKLLLLLLGFIYNIKDLDGE